MDDLFAGYHSQIDLPVAWGEMDAFGHVNNIIYFRYMENGRIAYLMQLGLVDFLQQEGIAPILASIQCRFKAPVTFPDTIVVATRVPVLAADRMTFQHRIVSRRMHRIVAEGEGVVVAYDYAAGGKAPLPDEVRQRIAAHEGIEVAP